MLLIAISSLSELMIKMILDNPGATLLTNSSDVSAQLKQLHLPVQNIYCEPPMTHEARDRQFAELAMPGVFGDTVFPNSDLPLYEVLSIDRLSFWNRSFVAETEQEIIASLQWDMAITDLNIYSTLPFAVLSEARKRNAKTIAIETVSLRSREVLLLGKYLGFDKFVVGGDSASFLARAIPKGKIIGVEDANLKPTANQSASNTLSGFAVVFDKEFEWEYRTFLGGQLGNFTTLVHDDRSKELLFKCVPPHYHHLISLGNTGKSYRKVIAFGWRDYLYRYGSAVELMDLGGKTLAEAVAP